MQKRLRWIGYGKRKNDGLVPKIFLFSETHDGPRKRGLSSLRYHDNCKSDMKPSDINAGNWEVCAKEHSFWTRARSYTEKGNEHATAGSKATSKMIQIPQKA